MTLHYELDDRIKALLMTDPSFVKMREESIADGYQRFITIARRRSGDLYEAVVVPVLDGSDPAFKPPAANSPSTGG